MKFNFALFTFISWFCFSTAFAQKAQTEKENMIKTLILNDWKLLNYNNQNAKDCPYLISFDYDANADKLIGKNENSNILNFDYDFSSYNVDGYSVKATIITKADATNSKIIATTVTNERIQSIGLKSIASFVFSGTVVKFNLSDGVSCAYEL